MNEHAQSIIGGEVKALTTRIDSLQKQRDGITVLEERKAALDTAISELTECRDGLQGSLPAPEVEGEPPAGGNTADKDTGTLGGAAAATTKKKKTDTLE